MYQVIGTVEQMEALSASVKDCIPTQVLERLKHQLEVFDKSYGVSRDIDTDLGGYVVLFLSMSQNEQTEHKNILERYHVHDDEYEYRNIILTKNNYKWIEELYILSSDYSIVIFYPVVENGGIHSDWLYSDHNVKNCDKLNINGSNSRNKSLQNLSDD